MQVPPEQKKTDGASLSNNPLSILHSELVDEQRGQCDLAETVQVGTEK